MKRSFLFIALIMLCVSGFSQQRDSISITSLNDSTYLYEMFSFDDENFIERIEREKLDSVELRSVVFLKALNADVLSVKTEEELNLSYAFLQEAKTEFNALPGPNYVTELTENRETILNGSKRLVVDGTSHPISINYNQNRVESDTLKMRYRFTAYETLRLRLAGSNTPFFEGTVDLKPVYKNGRIVRWKGRNDANDLVVLR